MRISIGAMALLFTCAWYANGQADTGKVDYPDYWSPMREYFYSAVYTDSAGAQITSERISIRPTGEVWKTDSKQTLADFTLNYSAADSARLAPFPLNNISRAWMRKYKEGVMQTEGKVWMHPVRSNQYVLTEIAPFPEVHLPLKAGDTWKSTLWIYEGFGTFEGTVESVYMVYPAEERRYYFGNIKCWKIISTGTHNKLGTNTAIYYFNEVYGFTEMNYHFYNNQKLAIKLIRLKK